EIAIAPAHLSGGDELLADHRHLHGRERGAERTLEVGVLGHLDPCRVRAQREALEPIARGHGQWGARRRRRHRGTARAVPNHPPADQRDGGEQHVESLHSSGLRRQGSSSSSSSAASRARRSASSTMRRLSAISGVSYVTRTSYWNSSLRSLPSRICNSGTRSSSWP